MISSYQVLYTCWLAYLLSMTRSSGSLVNPLLLMYQVGSSAFFLHRVGVGRNFWPVIIAGCSKSRPTGAEACGTEPGAILWSTIPWHLISSSGCAFFGMPDSIALMGWSVLFGFSLGRK